MRSDLVRVGALLLALFGFLLQGASLPHQHQACEPAFYNYDHDLGAQATVAGALLPLGPDPTPVWVVLTHRPWQVAVTWAQRLRRHADSRAPPSQESSLQS
jgi:hypothetical protein